MAAAARPNPADARVPCPLCGGLIHPIAGRCKHCKGDLSALRSSRPAAAASLPALLAGGNVQVRPHANGHANGHYIIGEDGKHQAPTANGHYMPNAPSPAPHAPAPMPQAMPQQVLDGMQPILPPRPTGRMYAARPASDAAWYKSWPLVVIILAGLLILGAVFLMVWPPGGGKEAGADPGKKISVPPAPERMDTDPLPPPGTPRSGDPWTGKQGNNGGGSSVDPQPQKTPDIDIPDDPDPDDPNAPDPGGVVGGTPGGNLSGSGAVVMGMMKHACDRAASCGQLDTPLKDYCEMAKKLPMSPPPKSCPAAQACFDHIDQMSCSAGFDDITALSSVMYKFQDCAKAISC